jgi:hypothetical protein
MVTSSLQLGECAHTESTTSWAYGRWTSQFRVRVDSCSVASTLDIGVVATGSMLCWVGIVSNPRNLVEHAYQMGSQADQLAVGLEAHVEPVVAPALDLALLVQPGGQRPVFLAHLDLLDPALLGNGGAGVA